MSNLPLYEYLLLNKNGEYYYVDNATGNVFTQSEEISIRNTPLGWQAQAIQFGRDEQLWGVFQGINNSLKFRGDGKKILETIFYNNDKYPYNNAANFEAYCRLIIKKRNDGAVERWSYDVWFDGIFDFSELVQDEDEDGNFIQVPLTENSLKQLFDVNKDTEYEIPITGIPEEDTVLMEGVNLRNVYDWIGANTGTASMSIGTGYVFSMGLIEQDGTNYFTDLIDFRQQGYEIFSLSGSPNDNNSFLYTDLQFTASITVSMEFNWLAFAGSDLSVILLKKNMSTNLFTTAHIFYSSGPVGGTLQNVQFTDTTTFTFDTSLFQYFIAFVPNLAGNYSIEVVTASMNITFDKALPTTDCKALKYKDYAKLLVNRAFEGLATLQSQYLNDSLGDLLYKFYDMYPNRVYITCGDALRQLPNPTIKGSLSDLIEDVSARYMCGVGIEGDKFVIETLDYFLRQSLQIGVINNPKKITKRTAKELLYGDIKAGYPDYRAEDLNGRFEWNSTQNFKTGFKKITENKELISPYKASVYEIEYLRSKVFSDGNTRDDRNDNSKYLLYCSNVRVSGKATLQKYLAADGDSISGVPNPDTQFNIAFSPHRNMQRWIPYWKSIYNIPDGVVASEYKIEYISSDRNAQLETKINGAGSYTVEYADIYPTDVPLNRALPRLFKPLIVEFEAIPDIAILNQIRLNKYGYLRVVNGSKFFGIFIMDVEVNGSEQESYKFRGLLTPDSDTTQFID